MKLRKRYIALLVFIALFVYNTYFPSWLITGSYISRVDNSFGTVGINDNENLLINSNGTYSSDAWGKGTWKLKHDFSGTRIIFNSNNEGYDTYFYRSMFFSKPRIVIFSDLNAEYRKNK